MARVEISRYIEFFDGQDAVLIDGALHIPIGNIAEKLGVAGGWQPDRYEVLVLLDESLQVVGVENVADGHLPAQWRRYQGCVPGALVCKTFVVGDLVLLTQGPYLFVD